MLRSITFHSVLLTSFLFLFLPGALTSQDMNFTAKLTGRAEVLPVATTGWGTINANLSGNLLTVTGNFARLKGNYDATISGGAHIHLGYTGQNGPIELSLTPTLDIDLKGGVFEALVNTFTLNSGQIAALRDRRMYVNIHTLAYGGGELRGQLLPEADANYHSNLFGSNENPTVVSNGSGGLSLELHGDTLIVSGSFQNLDSDFNANVAGGAHLHSAPAGSNGGVDLSLQATTDADLRSGVFLPNDNTFFLNPGQMAMLEARGYYANIHTVGQPSGELRGQVCADAQAVFRAYLSGSNETQTVTSRANGQILAELDGDQLVVSGSFDDLDSNVDTDIAGGAHLHAGPSGSDGAIEFPLNLTLNTNARGGLILPGDNTFSLTSDQITLFMERGVYANIHTEANSAGAIRGQCLPESQVVLNAYLSGNFETDPVLTRAHGQVKAELNGDRLVVSGSFDDLGSAINVAIAGGAHIHSGMAGSNGGVSIPLTVSGDNDLLGGSFEASDNTFKLDASQRDALLARGMYVNIHTLLHAEGELRGQLLPDANFYLVAHLSGSSQVRNVNTDGYGLLSLEVNGNTAICTGSFNNLSSNLNTAIAGGAHLHTAMAGSDGNVALVLDPTQNAGPTSGTFEAESNTYANLSSGMIDTLMHRMVYANVHSENHAQGELRGQCLPLATSYFTAVIEGLNAIPATTSSGKGALKLELTGDQLIASGSFSELNSDFNADLAGGSHLHLGGPSQTGSIELGLNAETSSDLRSGVYRDSANTFILVADQTEALYAGHLYANLHTQDHPEGEVRGQVLQEFNEFPNAESEILTPLDGTLINVEGSGDLDFLVTWLPSTDPDGNEVAYIWQLAADDNFDTILFQKNVGDTTLFASNFATIDALLDANDVQIGGSIEAYHRVMVSDGSDQSGSEPSSVTLERGGITGLGNIEGEIESMNVFPNPVETLSAVTMTITSEVPFEARIQLWNASGQILDVRERHIQDGKNVFNFDISSIGSASHYFIRVTDIEGRHAGTIKLFRSR